MAHQVINKYYMVLRALQQYAPRINSRRAQMRIIYNKIRAIIHGFVIETIIFC